jgi:hypothetical protein
MNALHVCTWASTLILLVPALASVPAMQPVAALLRATASGYELTGELVVTGPNRFRLVGHEGRTFAAPPGFPLQAFDGKPVRAEIGSDGRVLHIAEKPIHIDPITHEYEVVSGELVLADPVQRTFTLAGGDRTYVAPAYMDLRPYAGRRVEIRIDDRGRVSELRLAGAPPAEAVTSGLEGRCDAGGVTYRDGSVRCEHGAQFVCERGDWRNLGTRCAADETAGRVSRTCLVGDATVASGSTVCRNGMAFRCDDGEWVGVGTPCR